MKKNNKKQRESQKIALHYMATLVEVARESFLILDSNLRVISANPVFYQNFQVTAVQTEKKLLYKLGNGQWNIPELKKLLEEILPKKKVVKDYEVTHNFEKIGKKTIRLNARQIDTVQLIILAMEDISEKEMLEQQLASYTKGLEAKIAERTKALADKIEELESANKSMVGRELKMVELKREIENIKKRTKNGKKNGSSRSLASNRSRNGNNGKVGNGNHKNGR